MKKVNIQGTEYVLLYNLRALFVYEEVAGKPYTGERTIDNYLLMFAMLVANNKEFSLTFDEFINVCDEDLGLFQEFAKVMMEQAKRSSAFLENKKKAVM